MIIWNICNMHYEKLKEFGVFQNTIVCAKSKIMFYFSKRAKSGVHNIYTWMFDILCYSINLFTDLQWKTTNDLINAVFLEDMQYIL